MGRHYSLRHDFLNARRITALTSLPAMGGQHE